MGHQAERSAGDAGLFSVDVMLFRGRQGIERSREVPSRIKKKDSKF
jgi:hypothetical protein